MTVIGVLSDAHGNLAGFEMAVTTLKQLGAEKIFFLGDSIGYIPDVSVLTSLHYEYPDIICIRGNHEDMLLSDTRSYETREIYNSSRYSQMLSESDLDFITSWPTQFFETVDGLNIEYMHGSPDDHLYGYIYPDTDLNIYSSSSDYVFMGHSHIPFIREHQATCYINVGSCGLPRDDGRFGSVAILDTNSLAVEIIRLNIMQTTTTLLSRFPTLHASVRDIFDRRAAELVGRIL